MYIDANTVITAAAVVTALGVLGGVVAWVVKLVQRDRRQSAEIIRMQGGLAGADRAGLQRPVQGRTDTPRQAPESGGAHHQGIVRRDTHVSRYNAHADLPAPY